MGYSHRYMCFVIFRKRVSLDKQPVTMDIFGKVPGQIKVSVAGQIEISLPVTGCTETDGQTVVREQPVGNMNTPAAGIAVQTMGKHGLKGKRCRFLVGFPADQNGVLKRKIVKAAVDVIDTIVLG